MLWFFVLQVQIVHIFVPLFLYHCPYTTPYYCIYRSALCKKSYWGFDGFNTHKLWAVSTETPSYTSFRHLSKRLRHRYLLWELSRLKATSHTRASCNCGSRGVTTAAAAENSASIAMPLASPWLDGLPASPVRSEFDAPLPPKRPQRRPVPAGSTANTSLDV